MTPTLDRKRRQQLEDKLQAAVVFHLEARGVPGLLYWHTPNSSKMGGKRTPSGIPLAAIRLKKQGMLPGVSDLVFLLAGKFHALELKIAPKMPTAPQLAFLDRVRSQGGEAAWANDLDEALGALKSWGLIR